MLNSILDVVVADFRNFDTNSFNDSPDETLLSRQRKKKYKQDRPKIPTKPRTNDPVNVLLVTAHRSGIFFSN